MEEEELTALTQRVSALLVSRLNAGGRHLARQYRSVQGLLPKGVRNAMEVLIEAQAMAQSPKLRVRLDQDGIQQAARDCVAYLEPLPEGYRRSKARKDLLADIMLKLAVVIAMVIALLSWRGIV